MERRTFYLYKRKSGIYYAELLDPITNQRALYRSTGERDKDKALLTVGKWLTEGPPPKKKGKQKGLKDTIDLKGAMSFLEKADLNEKEALAVAAVLKHRGLISLGVTPAGIGNKPLVDFLYEFWNYEKSPYLRDRRAHGKGATKSTCLENARSIKMDWEPYFKNKLVCDITRGDLQEFGISLRKRLSAGSVNNRLYIGTTALRWAHKEKLLPENVAEGLGGFSVSGKTRDILSSDEVEKLKDPRLWESRKGYAAFMLASSSALRNGEIRALQRRDIGDGILFIRHGYNIYDGLKTPKNKKERTVYLLPGVKSLLLELLGENPAKNSEEQFIFFSDTHPKKPCDISIFPKYLRKAIDAAGIDLGTRRVDFHSLRHYVAKELADATGDLRLVGRITGHIDPKMAERYANHTSDAEMAALGEQAAKILSFNGRKGA